MNFNLICKYTSQHIFAIFTKVYNIALPLDWQKKEKQNKTFIKEGRPFVLDPWNSKKHVTHVLLYNGSINRYTRKL
jgi:hypothetical protein